MSVEQRCWAVCSPEHLIVEDFDTASFCYDRLSGETHLLAPFPAELFRFIKQSPHTASDIAHYLCRFCDEPYSVEWQQRVDRTLADLAALSLVTLGNIKDRCDHC